MAASNKRPPIWARVALILAGGLFVRLDHNPLVRLEARLGLSPSPLERMFGIRGFFSGMTESAFRLAHGDIVGSLQANVLTIAFLGAVLVAVLRWQVPKATTRRRELVYFAIAVSGTIINNLVPCWLD